MSFSTRPLFLQLLIVLSLFLGGCAATEPQPRFVWPPPPDEPRLEFIGNYYSEASFEKGKGGKLLAEVTGAIQGEAIFISPFGIATDGKGVVYVSDIYQHNVRVYNFNEKTVNFLTKDTRMASPLGLALDRQGNLYIADAGQSKIHVYGPDQQPRYNIRNEQELGKPAYLAVHEELQRLYVSDPGKNRIGVFSLAGDFLFAIGELGDTAGKFFAPQGIVFGPDGNLYVADSLNARIQVLTPAGEFVRMFGERGDQPGQFENPKDLAFDSVGNLHILEGRRSDLLTFTPEGQALLITGGGVATNSPYGFAAPRSIDIDASDRIYIAEATNKRFSIWQYMSADWLAKHPYTEADRQQLINYVEKLKKQRGEQEPAPAK